MRRPNRFPELILTCVFAALAGASATAQFSAGPSLPSLSGFTPAQGAQGSSVTIIFTGKNFVGKGLGLQFSPAVGLKVGILQAISSSQISAQVQIDAGAQVGPHGVLLVVADRGLQSNMPFVVTGAQCGMPGTPPCPPQTAPPALRGFAPLQGTQGSNVTVTFTGAHFSGAASAQFTPGAGITVRSTTVVNGNQIQAQLAVDANAPLGAHAVSLLLGKTRLQAQNTFTIVAGEKPGQTAPMQILQVIPNQVPACSENLDLTLIGTNFVPGTQVTFTRAGAATDVFVVGASRYVNSTELHVVVNVLPTALAGGRDINLETPRHQTAVGKGMLNVLAPSSSKQVGHRQCSARLQTARLPRGLRFGGRASRSQQRSGDVEVGERHRRDREEGARLSGDFCFAPEIRDPWNQDCCLRSATRWGSFLVPALAGTSHSPGSPSLATIRESAVIDHKGVCG